MSLRVPESGPDPLNSEQSDLLDLSMPASTGEISFVTDAISKKLNDLNVPIEKQLEIGLAVQEALANAVVHGCQNDASKKVRCQVRRDSKEGRILIIVTDPGPGFDPAELADPKRPESLYADHGRGVYLIRQLMDEVHFDKRGTEIKMWKF
jgi:serine/threonine-protein kinase RsbW